MQIKITVNYGDSLLNALNPLLALRRKELMFRGFDPDELYRNGAAQAFGYHPVSRLTSLTVDLSGTASDLTKTFAYNPASQIVSETRSNDAYAQVLANGTQTTTNGLNQLATVNGPSAALRRARQHDHRPGDGEDANLLALEQPAVEPAAPTYWHGNR